MWSSFGESEFRCWNRLLPACWTPHNPRRRIDDHRRVRGQHCKSRCGRCRASRRTLPIRNGVMPACHAVLASVRRLLLCSPRQQLCAAESAGSTYRSVVLPERRRTFSLLPDFLAAKLPDLLESIEDTVATAFSIKSSRNEFQCASGSNKSRRTYLS
jgi:hypothetical protein